jgi:hypothetical protein
METSMTPAMLSLHQLLRASPFPTKGSEANQICRSRGKMLYKEACTQAEGQGMAGPTPKPQPWGIRQPGSQTLNCNQAPTYIRGPGPLE